MKVKVLNLYACIGGNRKLWDDVEVTAVEIKPKLAAKYQELYPDDSVVVGDAEKYLLNHYKEFDFIWASPPCNTHSRIREAISKRGDYPPKLPDMKLYSIIMFLKHFSSSNKWVVENVKPYYDPLVKPNAELGRHLFWSNFKITPKRFYDESDVIKQVTSKTERYGFNLENDDIGQRKDQVLRSLVNPEIGLHILNCARLEPQLVLTSFSKSLRNENDIS